MLGFIGYVFLGCLLAGGLLWVIQRGAFGSWFHWLRTKIGQTGDFAASQDPAGQMRQAAIDASAELGKADAALAKCKSIKKSLQRQVDNDIRQLRLVETDVQKSLERGVADDDPTLVVKLQQIRSFRESIEENNKQILQQDTLYRDTLDLANAASGRIQSALQRAERLKVKLDLGVARRDAIALLQRYSPGAINTAMASIDRYEQVAQSQLDEADAALEVAADRGQPLCGHSNGNSPQPDVSDLLAEMKSKTRVRV